MRRLYAALCAWIEADAASKGIEPEPAPAGDNFTTTELDGRPEPVEMHQQHRPPAEYRAGFNNDHRRN